MIVVTGIGVLASPGAGREAFWAGLRSGRSAARQTPAWSLRAEASRLGFFVPEFDTKPYVAPAALRRLDRTGVLAICAAKMALADAKLTPSPARTGIVVGAGACGVDTTSGFHRRLVETAGTDPNPMAFPNTVPNAAAGQIAIALGITGYNTTLVQAGTAGEEAIALGFDLLRAGRVDAVIAGGVDEISTVLHHSLDRFGGLSKRWSRPFDRSADGVLLCEDAGFVVLERAEDAAKRGAKPLAELAGYGGASSKARPLTYGASGGASAAMREALARAGVPAKDVGWVNSAANGGGGDARAAAAVAETCPKAKVSSVAGACGESLAIGGVRAVASVLGCATGEVPPTAGLENPAFPLDFPRTAVPLAGEVIQHGAGTGGSDMCLVWRRVK